MERILGTETIERTVLTKGTGEGDKELNQQRRDCFSRYADDGMVLRLPTPPPLDKFEHEVSVGK